MVTLVGALALFFIYKKHLGELKRVSYVFLTMLGLFITLIVVEYSRDKGTNSLPFSELTTMKVNSNLPTAIAIFNFAYSMQFMVFPAYVELENRSNWRFENASLLALSISTIAYVVTGLTGALLFGSTITPDLLTNIGSKSTGLSIFVRTIYVLLLLFHLPYIFFTVKEYTLVMYDELMSRSLTTNLENKLRQY